MMQPECLRLRRRASGARSPEVPFDNKTHAHAETQLFQCTCTSMRLSHAAHVLRKPTDCAHCPGRGGGRRRGAARRGTGAVAGATRRACGASRAGVAMPYDPAAGARYALAGPLGAAGPAVCPAPWDEAGLGGDTRPCPLTMAGGAPPCRWAGVKRMLAPCPSITPSPPPADSFLCMSRLVSARDAAVSFSGRGERRPRPAPRLLLVTLLSSAATLPPSTLPRPYPTLLPTLPASLGSGGRDSGATGTDGGAAPRRLVDAGGGTWGGAIAAAAGNAAATRPPCSSRRSLTNACDVSTCQHHQTPTRRDAMVSAQGVVVGTRECYERTDARCPPAGLHAAS